MTMRILLYTTALGSFLLFGWIVYLTYQQSYCILEISTPPSGYGIPEVFIRNGINIQKVPCVAMDYIDHPAVHFRYRYKIWNQSFEEIRTISFQPASPRAGISGRFLTSNGTTIKTWDNSQFNPVSLEDAKQVAIDETVEHPDENAIFAFATPLDDHDLHHIPSNTVSNLSINFIGFLLFCLCFIILKHVHNHKDYFSLKFDQLFNASWSSPGSIRPFYLWLYCLVSVLLCSSVAWYLFGVRYLTADDPLMALIAKGYITNQPESRLVFIHPCLGFVISGFYANWPNFAWYPILFLTMTIFGMTSVFFSILENNNTYACAILCLICFGVSGIFLVACIQFTMVSFILGFAGFSLFLANAEKSTISVSRLILISLSIFVGALIRLEPILLLCCSILPVACYLYLTTSLPGFKRFLCVLFVVIAFVISTKNIPYQSDANSKNYILYNKVRGELFDTPVMKNYDDNKAIFQSVGWSRNDLHMFNSLLNQNIDIFSLEKLTYLRDHLKLPMPDMGRFFWILLANTLKALWMILLLLIWIILAWRTKAISRRLIFVLIGPPLVLSVYLILTARLPERVIIPILFSELSLLLLFIKRPAKIIDALLAAAVLIFIICLHGLLMINAWTSYADFSKFNESRKESTVTALMTLSNNDPPIILNSVPGAAVEQTYVWSNFAELKRLNILHLAWDFDSPEYYRKISRLQLKDPLLDLVTHKNIFLAVSVWDLKKVCYLEIYLQEHYGIHVKFVIANIPGSNRKAFFPYFNLFEAKNDGLQDLSTNLKPAITSP